MATNYAFTDKVAVISGAAAEPARTCALELARRGAKILAHDNGTYNNLAESPSNDSVNSLVQEINANGGVAVASYQLVENGEAIIQEALANFGKVDILIHNAFVNRVQGMETISEEDWDVTMKVNLKGAFTLVRAAWPSMRTNTFGRILMTSSLSAFNGDVGMVASGTSRSALHGFVQALAKEGERHDIRVNSIMPIYPS